MHVAWSKHRLTYIFGVIVHKYHIIMIIDLSIPAILTINTPVDVVE